VKIEELIKRLRGPSVLTCAKQDALDAADTLTALNEVYKAVELYVTGHIDQGTALRVDQAIAAVKALEDRE